MKKIYLPSLISCLFFSAGNTQAQTITTIAGTGPQGYNGDNIAASVAQLNRPSGVKVDASGNVFIADHLNSRIRKIGTNGFISTVAGTGSTDFNGDNMAASIASLNRPEAIDLDAAGNLFVEDTYNHRVRKVGTNGFISSVAGNGTGAYSGDNLQATNTSLNYPSDGVLVDAVGNIYISDSYNNRIRKVSTNGVITTIAGTGMAGYNGDNILATNAMIYYPYALALDGAGNLFFADGMNHRVRKIGTNGIITTVAGTGVPGYNGDNIAATSARLNIPEGIAFDPAGNLYISDYSNNRIRKVDNTGLITTVVGTGTAGYNGDNIPATLAQLSSPVGIAFDGSGNLYISDFANNRIRKVNIGVILPLSITSFTAQLQNGLGYLQWITSNEINTQNFVVEISKDGSVFSDIGTVKANNFAGSNSYSFADVSVKSGTTYYRLRMVDKNGKFTYSNIVTIKVNTTDILLNVYPNPVFALTTVSFSSSIAGKYILQIVDMAGRIITQQNGNAIVGTNNLPIDLHHYPAGTYTLIVTNAEKIRTSTTFIKK